MSERSKRRRQAITRIVRSTLPGSRPGVRHVAPIRDDDTRFDLAYASFRSGQRSIWITNSGAGDSIAVAALPGIGRSFDPAWSVDGSTLLFISDVDGHDNVHSLDLATGTVTRLTPNDADHRNPAMSPDGTSIVYLRARWPQPPQIWMMDPDGTNARPWFAGPGYKVRPTFRPDGASITAQMDTPVASIHAVTVDDGSAGALIDLSRNADEDTYPSWSPDGTRIVFAKTERADLAAGITTKQIWTMDGDGSNPRPLVTFSDVRHPMWSADGEWIVFDAETPMGRQVHFVRPDGTDLRRVTSIGDNHTATLRPIRPRPS